MSREEFARLLDRAARMSNAIDEVLVNVARDYESRKVTDDAWRAQAARNLCAAMEVPNGFTC